MRNAQFVYNMNSPNEKLLEWNYRSGFMSEDSDDEMTVYKRSERQYYRNLRNEFGQNSTLLKKRELKAFERLILEHLGGRKLLENLMDKTLDEDVLHVYDYQVTSRTSYEVREAAFLDVESREQFDKSYEFERDNQLASMHGNEDRAKSCVFANELLQIYELIRRVIRSQPDVQIYIEAANCLPIVG